MATPKNFIRNILFLSTTDTVNNSTGSVIVFGGISVQKNANISGNLTVSNITSIGLTTGNINFTGNLYQNGTSYIGSQWTGTSGTLYYGSGGNTFVGINTTNPSSTLEVNGNIKSVGITTGNINFTGNLYQNGSPYIGSQWSGTSGTLYYGSGGNTFVGINTTNPTSTLTVAGDIFISGNSTLSNLYLTNFSSSSLATNVFNIGSTSYLFAAAATAGNNTITPTIVSGLIFPIATTRSFVVVVSASTLCSVNPNYFTQYTIEGIQTDSGWVINDYIVGDQAIITFSINSTGQLLYTSTNVINWTSTTLRYKATGYFINSTSLPPNITTSGNFSVNLLTVTNTTDTISTTSGSVIINGGLGISKNINVGGGGTFGGALIPNTNISFDLGSTTNRWRTLFLSGTTIDLGGTLISATSGTIAFGSTILTTTTTGNLASSIQNLVSTTSTIGALTSTNILATNVSYSNASGLTATIPNVVHTNISTGALISTNISTINISYGNASGLTATIPNVVTTNISTGTLTSTNINTSTLSGLTAVTIPNVVHTNISTGSLSTNSIINTGISNLNFNSNTLGNLYTTGGNIGINTSSPSYTLDVNGGYRVTKNIDIGGVQPNFNGSTLGTLFISGTGNGGILMNTTQDIYPTYQLGNLSHDNILHYFDMYYDGTNNRASSTTGSFVISKNSNRLNFITLPLGSAGSILGSPNYSMVVGSTGNVGINSTGPGYTLDVNGSARISGSINMSSNYTSTSGGNIFSNYLGYNYGSGIVCNGFTFASPYFMTTQYQSSTGLDSVYLYTPGTGSASVKMSILHNGNVGINTTSPSYPLHVTGNIYAGPAVYSGTSINLLGLYTKGVFNSNINGFPATSGTVGNAIALRVRGGDDAVMDFGVNSASGSWIQTTNFTGYNANYPLLLNPNGGNVGINTNSPIFALDVNGSARISGSINALRFNSYTGTINISATGTYNISPGIFGYIGKISVYIGQIPSGIWGAQGDLIMPSNNNIRGNLSNITQYQYSGNQISATLQPFGGSNNNGVTNDSPSGSVQVVVTTIGSASTLYWTLTIFSVM